MKSSIVVGFATLLSSLAADDLDDFRGYGDDPKRLYCLSEVYQKEQSRSIKLLPIVALRRVAVTFHSIEEL